MNKPRVILFSAARAIGIVLVTIGHAEPLYYGFPLVFKVIYSFHMALFFFLSGVFSSPLETLSPAGYLDYAKRQVKVLGIPYLVVSIAFAAAKFFAPGTIKRPVHVNELVRDILVFPGDAPALFLWFVYTLFIVRLAWPLLSRLPAWFLFLGLLPFQIFKIDIPIFLLGYVFYYLAFYWLGAITGRRIDGFASLLGRVELSVIAGIVFIAVNAFGATHEIPPPARFAVAISGMFLVLAFCKAFEERLKSPVIELLDQRSFEIYLLQFFFIFPTTILCHRFGMTDLTIVVLDIIVGLLGPLLVVQVGLRFVPRLTSALLGTRLRASPNVGAAGGIHMERVAGAGVDVPKP